MKIMDLLDEYSVETIEKEFVQTPFLGYDLGYNFDAKTQIDGLEIREIESVKKYSGELSNIFTLYLKTTFKVKGNVKHRGKFVESLDEVFVREGRYYLRNEGDLNAEGLPSEKKVFRNLCLPKNSKVSIDPNLPDFNIEKFPTF